MVKKIFVYLFFCSFITNAQGLFVKPDSTQSLATIFEASIKDWRDSLFHSPHAAEFVQQFHSKFPNTFDKKSRYQALLSKNVDEWEMELYDERKSQLDFLKSYSQALDRAFVDYISQEIKWKYWHYLLAYPVIRSNLDTKLTRVVALPKVMIEAINMTQLNDEKLLNVVNFQEFLPFFVTYFNSEEQKFVKYSDQSKSLTDKCNFAEKKLKGKNLDYTLAVLMKENCSKVTPSVLKFWLSQLGEEEYRRFLLDNCKETFERKEEIISKTEKVQNDLDSSDLPIFFDLEGKKFNFNRFKGKVVYVDFWASWCGPCRAEFPFSKQIHESLTDKQRKNIVFLYISIDENEESWKSAIEKLSLTNGVHGISKGGFGSDATKKYQINSIPRYMIIDKNGQIQEFNASRPSNSETKEILLKLMN